MTKQNATVVAATGNATDTTSNRPTEEQVTDLGTTTAMEHGSLKTVLQRADSVARTEQGLRAWVEVAYQSSLSGMSTRKFAATFGGGKESQSRLLRLGSVLRAFSDKGLDVPAVMLTPWANRATEEDLQSALKAIRSGKVDSVDGLRGLPTYRRPKAITPPAESAETPAAETPAEESTPTSPNRETAEEISVTPGKYAIALEVIALRAAEIPDADLQRAMDAVTLIADALAVRLSGQSNN